VNAHTMQYHIVEEVGASSSHFVTDNEWNYIMLYLYTNTEEGEPYFNTSDKIH
jgi:hypothetical protein